MVKLLLKYNPELDKLVGVDKTSLLIEAVKIGDEKILTLLLDSGANPLVTDKNHVSALAKAAYLGKENMVRILLEKTTENIDSFAVIPDKNEVKIIGTPLMYAVQNGHNEVVDLLLKYGADKDIKIYVSGRKFISAETIASENGISSILSLSSNEDHETQTNTVDITSDDDFPAGALSRERSSSGLSKIQRKLQNVLAEVNKVIDSQSKKGDETKSTVTPSTMGKKYNIHNRLKNAVTEQETSPSVIIGAEPPYTSFTPHLPPITRKGSQAPRR